MGWSKGIIEWMDNNVVYISVPFTWKLEEARQRATFWSTFYEVTVGGPAVDLMPYFFSGVDTVVGESVNALPRHNPDATFTSRGCIRKCKFCAVPKIEGDLVELDNWEPKPIICDNNLLACSKVHFDKVIDSLKNVPGVDFNQGLDARLLTNYHAIRIAELHIGAVRLAWDNTKSESKVMGAISKLNKVGISNSAIRVYVLIGFDDTPEDALYRLQTLKDIGIRPCPQRFNPLDTLRRDSYVSPNWTDRELRKYMRYWSKRHLWHIPFEDYIHDQIDRMEVLYR